MKMKTSLYLLAAFGLMWYSCQTHKFPSPVCKAFLVRVSTVVPVLACAILHQVHTREYLSRG